MQDRTTTFSIAAVLFVAAAVGLAFYSVHLQNVAEAERLAEEGLARKRAGDEIKEILKSADTNRGSPAATAAS